MRRPRYPDEEGHVERDGVRIFYELYGDGQPTLVLLPTWTIVHSRVWKAQIAYLARHFRVLTFDPRGNGRSDRPGEPAQYAESEFAADAMAVMDATGTERAVIVSLSRGAQRALLLCAEHPERVLAAVFVAPWFPAGRVSGLRWRIMAHPRLRRLFLTRPLATWGWLKFNGAYWSTDYHDFVDWFIRRVFNAPHSTRQIEEAISWALETDAQTLLASAIARPAAPATRHSQLALARRVPCPVRVISAPDDKVTAHADARALAVATRGELLSVPDGGHMPQARKPVQVNLVLREFVESLVSVREPDHARV